MQIHVIAATNRQPVWVEAACAEYARRLRGDAALVVHDIALAKRRRSGPGEQHRADEAERMLKHVPPQAHVVALVESGALWSTADLVGRLEAWVRAGAKPYLLIGGPDGLGPRALERAAESWALSRLTLPHGLAKVIVIEALYRAFSVRAGHPYHRA